MVINYYCSGFDINDAFNNEIGDALKRDLVATDFVLYIPSAFNQEEKTEKYQSIFDDHFKKAGIAFKESKYVKDKMTPDEVASLVKRANLIFLMGGCPFKQEEFLKAKAIGPDLLLTREGINIGMSAGAMNMSNHIIITPCSEDYPVFDIRSGLNLNNISVFPHFNFGAEIGQLLDLGKEQIKTADLMTVAKQYGPFYLVQDIYDELTNTTAVSLIREANGELEFITVNQGKVWSVDERGFNVVSPKQR